MSGVWCVVCVDANVVFMYGVYLYLYVHMCGLWCVYVRVYVRTCVMGRDLSAFLEYWGGAYYCRFDVV